MLLGPSVDPRDYAILEAFISFPRHFSTLGLGA